MSFKRFTVLLSAPLFLLTAGCQDKSGNSSAGEMQQTASITTEAAKEKTEILWNATKA